MSGSPSRFSHSHHSLHSQHSNCLSASQDSCLGSASDAAHSLSILLRGLKKPLGKFDPFRPRGSGEPSTERKERMKEKGAEGEGWEGGSSALWTAPDLAGTPRRKGGEH